MKKALPIIVAVVVIIILALLFTIGRGSKHSSSNSSQANNPSMPSMSTSTPSPASQTNQTAQSTDKVTIKGFAFSPAATTVKSGTTVTWTNQDSVAHTVTENDSQAGPNSQSLDKGQSYSFTFTKAGTYHYHCAIHPDMRGTVTVTD